MSGGSVAVDSRGHRRAGGRGARPHPKGRQVDGVALNEVRELLGTRPRRRDLLIEHLHLVQDRHGCLSAAHLAALADEMGLAMAEVYEVATFYAHFDVVKEGSPPPPGLTVRVCDSLSCELMGAQALLSALTERHAPEVRVVRAPCMGRCEQAPVAQVGRHHVGQATPETVAEALAAGRTGADIPGYKDYDAYLATGGYGLIKQCLDGARPLEEVLEAVSGAGLRGMGGAGFPTARKWQLVRE